jgi:hypothetical protein
LPFGTAVPPVEQQATPAGWAGAGARCSVEGRLLAGADVGAGAVRAIGRVSAAGTVWASGGWGGGACSVRRGVEDVRAELQAATMTTHTSSALK